MPSTEWWRVGVVLGSVRNFVYVGRRDLRGLGAGGRRSRMTTQTTKSSGTDVALLGILTLARAGGILAGAVTLGLLSEEGVPTVAAGGVIGRGAVAGLGAAVSAAGC